MITRPYRIFVLDDSQDVIDLVTEYLKSLYGDNVVIFSNTSPVESLKLVEEYKINIILIDIGMPEMPGDDFLRKICEMRLGVEKIIVSGDATLTLSSSCFYDGAAGYIRKPFSKQEFKEVLDLSFKKLDHWAQVIKKTYHKE